MGGRDLGRRLLVGLACMTLLAVCAGANLTPAAMPSPASPAAAAATPPSTPHVLLASGRIVLAEAGFAITLDDGWVRVEKPDEVFFMAGGVLLAREVAGPVDAPPAIGVFMVTTDRLGNDPIATAVEQIVGGAGVKVARANVELPAGPAVRLQWIANDRQAVAFIVGGGRIAPNCHAESVVHVIRADLPATQADRDKAAVDRIARSFELVPLGVVECGQAGGAPWLTPRVTWSLPQRLGKYGDVVSDMIGWKAGFVAIGTECPVTNPVGGSCPVTRRTIAWASTSGGAWDRIVISSVEEAVDIDVEQAFGGLVAIQTSTAGAAIVWTSRDGRSWSQLSQLGGTGSCPSSQGADPFVTGVFLSGRSLIVTGIACEDGTTVDRTYQSSDGINWTVVPTMPADAEAEGVSLGLSPPGDEDIARAGSWYIAADDDPHQGTTTWLWVSPDGMRWREFPAPAGAGQGASILPVAPNAGPSARLAGRNGLLVMFTSTEGWDGFDVWRGRITGFGPSSTASTPPQTDTDTTTRAGVATEIPPGLGAGVAIMSAAALYWLRRRRSTQAQSATETDGPRYISKLGVGK